MTQPIGNGVTAQRPRRFALAGVAAACALLMTAPQSRSHGDAVQSPPASAPLTSHRVVQSDSAPAPVLPPGAVPGQAYQTYLLRYKFANRLSYEYAVTIDMTGTVATGATVAPISSHETATAEISYQDVSADGSQATVTYKYLSLTANVNGTHRALSDSQLRQLSEAMPSMRMAQSGKLVSVGTSASPGPVSQIMSTSQMLQGAPLPEAATALGGTWRGLFSGMGADTYVLSSLDSVAADPKGDQVFTINQKLSEQSKADAQSAQANKRLGRVYIYETGTGQQKFDNTLGTLQSVTITLGGKVTAEQPGSANPVRTNSTTTISMQLIPPAPPVPST